MNYSKDEITLINEAEKVSDLPDNILSGIEVMNEVAIPTTDKETVSYDSLKHRSFLKELFWQKIPAFRHVTLEEFMDTKFQNKNTVKKIAELRILLEGLVDEKFLTEVEDGMAEAPMNIRLSPYILSLIDWSDPYNDPLRIQFLPVSLSKVDDHPKLTLDSLHEQDDSPVSGLVHRYHDKALFLPLDVCPVYCRFCTRSYAIGSDTD
jgi:lysine 2,3-aminomutase